VFERLVDEPELEAWPICWMPGQHTGFHDHDLSSGAVTILSGAVKEERLRLGTLGKRSRIPRQHVRLHLVGDPPRDARGRGAGRHASRVLTAPAKDGRIRGRPRRALQRHPLGYGEELKPVQVA
jgi:hypothetical protein